MTASSVTFIAYSGASLFSLALIFAFATQLRTISLRPVFALAAAAQSIWLLSSSLALYNQSTLSIKLAIGFDSLHQLCWLWALVKAMQYHCNSPLPKLLLTSFIPIGLIITLLQYWASPDNIDAYSWHWSGPTLLFALGGLLCINRLYCSTSNIRLLKLICITLGATFAFNAYDAIALFSGLASHTPINLTRASVVLLASIALLIGTVTLPKETVEPHARLALSRTVILYIALFSLCAAIITVFALASLHIRRFGGGIGEALYLLIVAAAILSVVILLTSHQFRDLLNVLINKHLFSHKYDYRGEWLKLIEGLSKPANSQEAYGIALNAVLSIFKSPGGALYLYKGPDFQLARQQHCQINPNIKEHASSPFARVLRESEWVFFPRLPPTQTPLDRFNETLPDWIRLIDDVWLVMPLVYETKLTGFIIMTEPKIHTSLNWEDLDLLKITGRQIASYLEGHRKSEALSEAKQFETFNKLSAFVMHDLKNLIAQQSLLTENAEKHKDNPAFIEDAFTTIRGSVDRLNTLLHKLQRQEPEASRTIDLKQVIIEAVSRCSRTMPIPSLRLDADNLKLRAAPDTLCMVFVHLIQNAQDATKASGFVDVHIQRDENTVKIMIDDNGKGMDEYFLQNSLFKPFETTKAGKGMGIGVYQAKDYIEQIGGTVGVTSQINVGTTFTITLPLLQHQ